MVEFDLTQFKIKDCNPDPVKAWKRDVVAAQLVDSGITGDLLLQKLAHVGLHLPKENSIIQDKLPETAAGESLNHAAEVRIPSY